MKPFMTIALTFSALVLGVACTQKEAVESAPVTTTETAPMDDTAPAMDSADTAPAPDATPAAVDQE